MKDLDFEAVGCLSDLRLCLCSIFEDFYTNFRICPITVQLTMSRGVCLSIKISYIQHCPPERDAALRIQLYTIFNSFAEKNDVNINDISVGWVKITTVGMAVREYKIGHIHISQLED